LPVGSFGSSSRNSIRDGALKEARLPRQYSINSSAVAAPSSFSAT
jgi:hypothetical protein